MAKIEICGSKKYLKYLKSHLEEEHPKTKYHIEIELESKRKKKKR